MPQFVIVDSESGTILTRYVADKSLYDTALSEYHHFEVLTVE